MTTWNDVIKRKLSRSDYMMIAANLLPVAGVWFMDWSAQEVFVVYCLETIIIGLFTLLKLAITGSIKKYDDWQNQGTKTKMHFIGYMLFFLVHYGMFVAIQMGMFFAISGIADKTNISFFSFIYKWPELLSGEAYIMLGVFVISYGFRNISEFIMTGEYRTTSLNFLMFQPYGRIFVQQFTVIAGSIFLGFGAGKIFILIFSAVKIFIEVFVDYDSIIRKAAKGELNPAEKEK